MKFTADAMAFQEAIKRASVAVETRTAIPVLANVLLTAGGSGLSVFGTDMDCEVTARASATVDSAGAATVNAKALGSLARGWTKGSMVEIESVDGAIVVRNGRASTSLATLPASDVPHMKDQERPHRFSLPAATLLEEINAVRHAISTEETRYYLNGILWEGTEESLRMVTTDGHRMAKSDIVAPEGGQMLPQTIVPRCVTEYLRKLFAGKNRPEINIEVGTLQLRFVCGDIEVRSKVIDGKYPDYHRVIPRSNGVDIAVDRADLVGTLGRLVKMTDSRGSHSIEFDAVNGSLSLSAKNIGEGTSAAEAMPAQVKKGPIKVGFNGKYLLDMLATMTAPTVTLHLSDAASPALVSEGTREFVIMPVRVYRS